VKSEEFKIGAVKIATIHKIDTKIILSFKILLFIKLAALEGPKKPKVLTLSC